MAESWVRLWADMTTDPKWQTIARKSGQPRALVIATFTHLMLEANESIERGSITGINIEDVASAMDCDEEAVAAILDAMEGRVITDGRLAGWERRQPLRNDSGNENTGAMSNTERSRKFREKQRTQRDGNGRNEIATQGNAPEAEAESETSLSPNPSERNEDLPGHGDERDDSAPTTPTPAGQIAKELRRRGVAVMPSNPDFAQWIDSGLTVDEAIAGFEIARVAKPAPEAIPWNYLSKVLASQRRPSNGSGVPPKADDPYGGMV